jgi:peptidoglycan hydrolase CwlO-like protein
MKKTSLFIIATAALMLTACGNSRRAEIEARKAALKQKQDSALTASQERLAQVDSLLEQVKAEHDRQHEWVMSHSTQLNDQSPEVLRLNQLRAHRDSLQAEWETLGAKIKYIRKRQAESDSIYGEG